MKRPLLILILQLLYSFYGVSQSALFLNNDVQLKVEPNAIITVNGNFVASDAGDSALISNDGVIEMLGNWNNNGSGKLTDNSTGNILFAGSSAQTIQGNTAFYNLEIENTSGVSITSGLTEIKNELQLTLGNFSTGASLKLNSIASKTARIAPILTGSISGEVTIECFIENEAYDYRFLSMPVQNQTIDEWSDDILLTGFTGTPYPSFHFNNVFFYRETLSGDRNSRYQNATNTTNPVAVGEGAQIYLGAADIKVDVTGNIYSGNINFPVTYTDDITQPTTEEGWNLIGNPYPSTIDWTSLSWTKVNMSDAIYIYEGSTDNYQSYVNGAGANGGTQYIPSSQAFWVKADGLGVPSLSATENVKTSQDAGFIERLKAPDLLRLKVSDGTSQDEIVVRYHKEATTRFDPSWDAYKIEGKPIHPILTAIQLGESYSILSMNPDSLEDVFLKVEVPSSGTYSLVVEELPVGVNCLYLEDLFTGRVESLRDSASFQFNFSDTTNIPRFKLTASKLVNYQVNSAACYGDTATIIAEKALQRNVILSWYSSNQQTGVDSNFSKSNLFVQDGLYHFTASSASCSSQENYFTIDSPDSLSVLSTIVADSGLNNGSIDLTILGGTSPYSVSWSSFSSLKGTSPSGLSAGTYKAIIADANGCMVVKNNYVPGVTVGIEEKGAGKDVSIFPNPTHDFIHVKGFNTPVQYDLYDEVGRLVLSGTLSLEKKSIQIKEFSSGIYLLRLTSEEGIQSFKIKKITE